MRFAFFSLFPGTGNIAKEMLMAATLAIHGDQAMMITCDGALVRCTLLATETDDQNQQQKTCHNCRNGLRILHKAAFQGLIGRTDLSLLIDPARQQMAYRTIAQLSDEDLFAFRFDGHPMGEWIQSSLRIEFYGEKWWQLPNLTVRAREYLRGTVNAYLGAEGCINRFQPDVLVVMNGIPASARAILEASHHHGLRCVTYEQGQRPYTFALSDTVPVARYDFTAAFTAWRGIPLSAAEDHRLEQFLHRRHGTSSEDEYVWSPVASQDASHLYDVLEFDPDKPIVTVFSNLAGDTAVFDAEIGFEGIDDWLSETVTLAQARPDVQFILRAHPVEATLKIRRDGRESDLPDRAGTLIRARWPVLPANVRLIDAGDPISSYDLLQVSRLVIVYTGTIGMEAAAMGLPVIVAGASHYRHCGFVWTPETSQDYKTLIDRHVATPHQPPNAQTLLRRYLFLFYFRSCFHLPALQALHDLDRRPDDQAGFLAGYRRMLELAKADHPDQIHILRYLRGDAPYVLPPPAWRVKDGHPAPDHPRQAQILVLPTWGREMPFIERLLRPAQAWPFAHAFQLSTQGLPMDQALYRMMAAFGLLGPVETWPEMDLLPTMTSEAWASLLHGCHACVYDADETDPLIIGMAQQLGIPCFDIGSATLVEDLLPALPGSRHSLSATAIFRE